MADAVPARVPTDLAETARDTLGGAAVSADQLPAPLAAELLDAARDAFTQGLQVAALTSAAVAAGTAVLAAVALRRVRAGSQPEGQPDLEPARADQGNTAVKKVLRPAAAAPERRCSVGGK